jgi:hypothetical protein
MWLKLANRTKILTTVNTFKTLGPVGCDTLYLKRLKVKVKFTLEQATLGPEGE